MLQSKVGQIEEKLFDQIITDALYWLVDTFGDRSLELNKKNYFKKGTVLRPYTFKQNLNLVYDYDPSRINWHYYGQFAEYQTEENVLVVHCDKRFTLEFILDGLFHEFKHSQQSMYLYHYKKIEYSKHPYEIEANAFALEQVPIFWDQYKIKLDSI